MLLRIHEYVTMHKIVEESEHGPPRGGTKPNAVRVGPVNLLNNFSAPLTAITRPIERSSRAPTKSYDTTWETSRHTVSYLSSRKQETNN